MRTQHHDEQEEAGWISLVDLLTVLALIGVVVAVGYAQSLSSSADAARLAQEQADARVGELEQRLARAEQDAGDWRVTATNLQVKFDRLAADCAKGIDVVIQERDAAVLGMGKAEEEKKALEDKLTKSETRASKAEDSVKTLLSAVVQAGLPNPLEADADGNQGGGAQVGEGDGGLKQGKGGIGQELLGFPGALNRVVFVIDRSQSMTTGNRWEEAKQTIKAYIKHLPVSHTALVVFGSDVKTIPSSLHRTQNQLWNTQPLPAMTPEIRQVLTQELDSINPQGETRTRRALHRAMEFENLDAIILFTDGAPDSIDGGDSRQSVMELVRNWSKEHPEAHIHTVGIGDYFNESMRDFLLGIARATKGGFVGK